MKINYKNFDSTRNFGVELEVGSLNSLTMIERIISDHSRVRVLTTNSWSQTQNQNDFWHIKKDSTCGDNGDYGWEIASFCGSGIEDIIHIGSVFQKMNVYGIKSNNNCGFHIHADISDFDQSQAAILLAYWIKIEPIICLLVPDRRINNSHCKLWFNSRKFNKKNEYSALEFWEKVKPNDLKIHNNISRRVSLNFVNFVNYLRIFVGRPTVELRLPDSNVSKISTTCWIKLYLNFIEACKNRTMPSNLQAVSSLDEFFEIIGLSHQGSDFNIWCKSNLQTRIWILDKIIYSPCVSYRYFQSNLKYNQKIFEEAGKKYSICL